MQLVIAINCEREKAYFQSLQKDITFSEAKLTTDYLLTLKFLGNIKNSNINFITTKLEEIKQEKFFLAINHIGCFSQKQGNKIIWAGMQKSSKLRKLRQKIEQSLASRFSFQRRFVPHITLARINKRLPDNSFKKLQALSRPLKRTKKIPVTNISLLERIYTSKGITYKIFKTFKLQ